MKRSTCRVVVAKYEKNKLAGRPGGSEITRVEGCGLE
jgi:hypothetical protein